MEGEIMKWNRLSGDGIVNIFETIEQDIIKYTNDFELKFYTGCDSQVHNDKVRYITAIVLYRQGKGGLVYYRKEIEAFKNINPQKRLWNEVVKAVEVAQELDDILIKHDLCVEEVHADLNYDKKYLSSKVVDQCLGYIKAMGFDGVIKPYGFTASKIADRVTRNRKNPEATRLTTIANKRGKGKKKR